MEYRNYTKIQQLSLLYDHYCFIDTEEYLADGIFYQKKITVKFGREYVQPGEKYRLIFCKICKKDREIFIESMEALKKKMLLNEHRDYTDFCEKIAMMLDNKW